MKEKVLLTTLANDHHIEGTLTLLYSLRKENPWIEDPFRVICHDELCPLSAENRERLTAIWPNIGFYTFDDPRLYSIRNEAALRHFGKFSTTRDPRHGHILFLKLQVFRYKGFERIIFFDSDMLCVGDLRHLWELPDSFAAAQTGNPVEKYQEKVLSSDAHYFNTGMFVLNAPYTDGSHYHAIMESTLENEFLGADQDTMRFFMKDRPVYYVDAIYNVNINFLEHPESRIAGRANEYRILHYVHKKPWERSEEEYRPCDRRWLEVHEEAVQSTEPANAV